MLNDIPIIRWYHLLWLWTIPSVYKTDTSEVGYETIIKYKKCCGNLYVMDIVTRRTDAD